MKDDSIKIVCAGMPKDCFKYVEWQKFKEGFSCMGKLAYKHVKRRRETNRRTFYNKKRRNARGVEKILKKLYNRGEKMQKFFIAYYLINDQIIDQIVQINEEKLKEKIYNIFSCNYKVIEITEKNIYIPTDKILYIKYQKWR